MKHSISLVTTVYNREKYLKEAIKSVLQQTRRDFELLIWDDGSTDDSVKIAQSYEKQDSRIRVVAAPHGGNGSALSNAVAETTGKYLGWVDSDDLLEPEALEKTAEVLENNPHLGMVYTDCFRIDEEGKMLGLDKRSQLPYSPERMLTSFITFHFRLIRRSVYSQIGGVLPEYDRIEDYELCLRLSEATEIQRLPKPLYKYRVHKNSISGSRQEEQSLLFVKVATEALHRRGLSEEWELDFAFVPYLKLKEKTRPLNSSQVLIDNQSNRLRAVLEDIVYNLEIRADFSIVHPGYKLELPEEAISRFQKMPEQIQQKYLSLRLRSFLYSIYYGSMRQSSALNGEDDLPLDLENNGVLGVDLEFYNRIHESNSGRGYFEPGWIILKEESDGSLAVTKDGLKLHIERNEHLQIEEQDAVVGDVVAIKMPKNRVQNGFYVSVGDARVKLHQNKSVFVRIYFNLTSNGAVEVMGSLTQQLNDRDIPFDFKVLYNPQDYQRNDSGVLYFSKSNYGQVHRILQQVYQEHQSDFKAGVPLFTLQLAPGLALAEEPGNEFAERENFGMNRCQIIADGLLEAWYQQKNSPNDKMQCIFKQFSLAGIDLNQTYLNADSENIYQASL